LPMIRSCTFTLADTDLKKGRMSNAAEGFTLVELMIVVAIVAILVTLSYPSYVSFIRKSERSDAQAELLDWANRQHLWRADHISYNTGINPANSDKYKYTMPNPTTTSFTLTATAQGGQSADNEDGINCSSLSLDETGMVRLPVTCWR
jgi:type IV pilus assembly protein PilE